MTPRDILLAALATLMLGANFVAVKTGVEHIPPVFLTGLRFLLVALLMIWFYPMPRGQLGGVFVFSVAQGVVHHGLMFVGLTGIDASVSAIVMQLCTPFAVLLAWAILGERFGWRRMLGIAVAFSGVVVIAGRPEQWNANVYLGILILSALAWGFANVHMKRMGEINVLGATAWMSLFAAPQLFVISAVAETGQLAALAAAPMVAWASLVYMALGATVVGYGIWYHMLRRYSMGHMVPFALTNPVIGVAAGVIALGETLTWDRVAGGLIVLTGVAIVQLRTRRAPTPAT